MTILVWSAIAIVVTLAMLLVAGLLLRLLNVVLAEMAWTTSLSRSWVPTVTVGAAVAMPIGLLLYGAAMLYASYGSDVRGPAFTLEQTMPNLVARLMQPADPDANNPSAYASRGYSALLIGIAVVGAWVAWRFRTTRQSDADAARFRSAPVKGERVEELDEGSQNLPNCAVHAPIVFAEFESQMAKHFGADEQLRKLKIRRWNEGENTWWCYVHHDTQKWKCISFCVAIRKVGNDLNYLWESYVPIGFPSQPQHGCEKDPTPYRHITSQVKPWESQDFEEIRVVTPSFSSSWGTSTGSSSGSGGYSTSNGSSYTSSTGYSISIHYKSIDWSSARKDLLRNWREYDGNRDAANTYDMLKQLITTALHAAINRVCGGDDGIDGCDEAWHQRLRGGTDRLATRDDARWDRSA